MRIKRGVVAHKKHKKVLKATKGYLGSNHKLIKRAREAMWHAGDYSFRHRRRRASDYRALWIGSINSGVKAEGIRYSEFINMLKKSGVELNRKVLAWLAVDYPSTFSKLVNEVK